MRADRRSQGRDGPRARRCAAAIAAACAVVLALGSGRADDRAGRVVLFDGKTLDGWKKTDFSRPGEVKVEGGAIVMPAGRPMTGVTCTRRDLPATDYELSYEAMRLAGGDFFAAATFPVGKSHITLVNGGWGGTVTGLSSLNGADASENETTRSYKYKDRTWYKFRVRVTGRAIRCWVDDEPVVGVDIEGLQVGTRPEVRANRPLGFATWETAGAVRKVEVRPLTPAEVAETDKAVKRE
jgi:hypothetical protein